jgi:hypothetical protein
MYRRVELPPTSPENFEFPSEGKLSPDNRWVIIANLIPWSEFEEEYAVLRYLVWFDQVAEIG